MNLHHRSLSRLQYFVLYAEVGGPREAFESHHSSPSGGLNRDFSSSSGETTLETADFRLFVLYRTCFKARKPLSLIPVTSYDECRIGSADQDSYFILTMTKYKGEKIMNHGLMKITAAVLKFVNTKAIPLYGMDALHDAF